MRGNQRLDGGDDIAAGEEVRLDVIDGDVDARLFGGDAGVHDQAIGDLAEAHGDEGEDADVGAGEPSAQPNAKEREDDAQQDEAADAECDEENDGGVHRDEGLETMRRKASRPTT